MAIMSEIWVVCRLMGKITSYPNFLQQLITFYLPKRLPNCNKKDTIYEFFYNKKYFWSSGKFENILNLFVQNCNNIMPTGHISEEYVWPGILKID
jgi:hypothetical protein